MKTTELILLICGGTLFICSLVFMFMLFKKDKPMTKMIWFMALSFIMMGFSVISEANIAGLVEYKKEEVLADVESLTEALAQCPENEELKSQLTKKVDLYIEKDEKGDTPAKPKEVEKIGNAYLTLGNQEKVISYSEKVLAKDTSNQAAKDFKKVAQTQQLIKEMPTSDKDKRALAQKISINIKELENSPTVQKVELFKLRRMYKQAVFEMKQSESQ